MFTKWHEVEDWIRDNRIKKWVFSTGNPKLRGENEAPSDRIVDTRNWDRGEDGEDTLDFETKLALTKKYLEAHGNRVYGVGFSAEKGTKGGLFCEACLSSSAAKEPVGVAPLAPAAVAAVDEDKLVERIRREIKLEYEQRDYERDRKNFEDERRQFEADKASVLGAVVGYLKPYIPVLNELGSRKVAGLDTERDVEAARIHAVAGPEHEEDTQENVFTDEEADKLMELMERFKKVEPDYLRLLESVVKMAESGDSTYSMAKQFLLK